MNNNQTIFEEHRTNKPGLKAKEKEYGPCVVYLACTSGGKFQVRVATSRLIVSFL